MEHLKYSFVVSMLLAFVVSGRVLGPTNEQQEPIEEVPDPSYFLYEVRRPTPREEYIHQLSKNILEVTKDLLSFEPRSGAGEGVEGRLATLRNLPPAEVTALLQQQGLSVPPPAGATCDINALFYRSMDGSCNNLHHPCWGKVDEPYQRWLPPAYANGVDALRRRADGGELPNPRQVYQWVCSQFQQNFNTTYPSLSNVVVFWGQMLTHEMLLTPIVTVKKWNGNRFVPSQLKCCKQKDMAHPECIPIVMDLEDGFFPKGHCFDISRSAAFVFSPSSCTPLSLGLPRDQMNQLTSFIDASLVYGSSEETMRKIRENGGQGAKLIMDRLGDWTLLPRRNRTCKSGHRVCDKRCFLAGERRANENPFLGALHTMWAREHNRLVDKLRIRGWPEETLFHVVRKIVGALMQHVTYKEYLLHVLGPRLPQHLGLMVPTQNYKYNPKINPTVVNAFATAAFRFGHSMLEESYSRMELPVGKQLSADFFSMDDYCSAKTNGDPIASLMAAQVQERAQRVDNVFSRQITNHLFAKEVNGMGLDLFSINLQRGRDHGLAPYSRWRDICGLPKVKDYDDLKGVIPQFIIDRLAAIYGPNGVHEVDLYVAGVSELPVNGGLLGPTFTCIVSHQFSALKFGDRFWYENLEHPGAFNRMQIASIQKTTLASLLCRNSAIQAIQPMAFKIESEDNRRMSCNEIVRSTDLDVSLWP
ncbi:peroxidasin homolog [Trichonephila clavata]|uniref:Peroxidasin homolog n=1 Tax=Trichonephila clavata TaxID=2740835 RepID=A0A8X6H8G9_TRICU|nr:peroxidasin homolog [Trichonephila clavata]